MVADGAVFNLPHPAVEHWHNDDTQLWIARDLLVNVNSDKLGANQLLCCELRQSTAVNLTSTNKKTNTANISIVFFTVRALGMI